MFSNIYMNIAIIGLVLLALVGAAWYYKSSQETIANLNQQIGALNSTIETQNNAIKTLEHDINHMQTQHDKLTKEMNNIQKEANELKKLFSRHDLEKIGNAKPDLLTKRMNDAIKKLFDDLENITKGNN